MHVAHRFEHLLEAYKRPDGSMWTGQQIDEATGGVVARSYVTNLRKGRIGNPGYEKMLALVRTMGSPPEAWFEKGIGDGPRSAHVEGLDLAARVGHLFRAVRHPRTGEPYRDAQVARMTLGELSEGGEKGIRTRRIPDPTVGQVAALAAAFGVPTSYLVDRNTDPSALDEGTLKALPDETAGVILRESARLPRKEKEMVLGIGRQFAVGYERPRSEATTSSLAHRHDHGNAGFLLA